jgi:hypothetical protein
MEVAEGSAAIAGLVPPTSNVDAHSRNSWGRRDKPTHDDMGKRKLSPTERAYRRCAMAFVTVLFGGIGLIYLFLLVVDPWDTGRFPTPMPSGVVDIERRTATASRGRDPRFDAAIFGNSRTFSLDPEKISKDTGYSFVSLGTPGAGPQEELTVARYFLRFHPAVQAIVFSTDERWCSHDPSMPMIMPFPFWLYRGNLEYFANLLSTRSFNAARARIRLALGRETPTDPRGYLDYEAGRVWNFHPPVAIIPAPATTPAAIQADAYFPALDALGSLLAELPRETRFLIMMPPAYQTYLPRPGTKDAADLAACKAGLAHRLGRQGITFLDYLVDDPITRDPENFMDMVHYRGRVARDIEDGIIAAFNGAAREGQAD